MNAGITQHFNKQNLIFGLCFTYNLVEYQDVPGFLSMTLLGKIVNDNSLSEDQMHNINIIAAVGLATSFLTFNTSFLNPMFGLIVGEVLCLLAKNLKEELAETLKKTTNKIS